MLLILAYPAFEVSSSVTSLRTGASKFFHPARNPSSIRKTYSTSFAPIVLTNSPVAFAEPPSINHQQQGYQWQSSRQRRSLCLQASTVLSAFQRCLFHIL